jgi:hypothetical protein
LDAEGVKVSFIGKIHDDSIETFKRDFNITNPPDVGKTRGGTV